MTSGTDEITAAGSRTFVGVLAETIFGKRLSQDNGTVRG
jgi:hypothetical protein